MWWTACDTLKSLGTLVEGKLVTDGPHRHHRPPLRGRLGGLASERLRSAPGPRVAGATPPRSLRRPEGEDRGTEAPRDDGGRDPDGDRIRRLRGRTRAHGGPADGRVRAPDRGRRGFLHPHPRRFLRAADADGHHRGL